MESKSFSSRGIQQEDVWNAADSLIADGLRPTIERIRQRIGRGSPNTVSPMLESWFATLASRLGVSNKNDAPDDLPLALHQAVKTVWEIALSKGQEASALEITRAQDDLKQATLNLIERQTELDQLEKIRTVKLLALEECLSAAKSTTGEALATLNDVQRLASKREKDIDALQNRLIVVETAREADRHRNLEITAAHFQERKNFETRSQSTQHKLLEEIDRARQETKKVVSEIELIAKKFSDEKVFLKEKIKIHEKEFSKLQIIHISQSADLDAIRKLLVASDSRLCEIQEVFKAQLHDSNSVIISLTEAFSNQDSRRVSEPKYPVSKFKRTRNIRKR